ncbi:TetR/AcrR family transcriptional regulator [Sabulicella rubraurantiaca]|uniref:TetR/AcrR family transcriptional regulator n=1 Tax=Sabulicella rubraurantiaca TaxID=2811429 RepID=UPI001A96A9A4|nr:TetR/AcrR family transcriptional regulator [Sabulicella rubraurantiaca]
MDTIVELLELDEGGEPPQGRILQIFDVACRLFAQRGFDGVSMRDIATECGVSKATLYHYFPDKDSILRPLAMGTTRSLFQHVAKHDDPAATPLVRLRSFLVETARFFERFRWAWIAGSTAFWSDPKTRARKERIAWRDRYEQLLREILQAGIEAGDLREMDVRIAGRFVLGSINWMPRWYDPAGPLSAAEIADSFCGMIIDGLRAPAAVRRKAAPG